MGDEAARGGFALQAKMVEVVDGALTGDEPGGTIISAETGSGKTTAVCKVIAARLQADHEKVFIYMSPTRANRNEFFEKLRSMLPPELRETVYNVESAIDVASSETRSLPKPESVPGELRPELERLGDALEIFRYISDGVQKGTIRRDYLDSKGGPRERLQLADSDLRDRTRIALAKECGRRAREGEKGWTPLRLVDEEDEWGWVRDLWPQVDTAGKRVLVMTPQKFRLRHDTIVTGSISFLNPDYLAECVSAVIMDESDAIKGIWLKDMIRETVRNGVDAVEAVSRIARALQQIDDPRSLQSLKGLFTNSPELVERFIKLKADINLIFERERLRFHYKLDSNQTDYTNRSFVFSGVGDVLLSTGGSRYSVRPDKYVNTILPRSALKAASGSKGLEDDGGAAPGHRMDINVTIDSCSRVLRRFCLAVGYWAKRLRELDDEARPGLEPGKGYAQRLIEFDEGALAKRVSSILSDMGLFDPAEPDFKSKLTRIIMELRLAQVGNSGSAAKDLERDVLPSGVYADGVSLYEFRDDESHDSITAMTRYSLTMTPELLYANICRSTKAILISATAGVRSVKNVPLDLFREQGLIREIPEDRAFALLALSEEETRRRRELYSVDVIIVEDDARAPIESRVSLALPRAQEPTIRKIGFLLEQIPSIDDKSIERYLFLCRAYAEFLESDDSEAGLVFLAAFPKEGRAGGYTRESLYRLLSCIRQDAELRGIMNEKVRSRPEELIRMLNASAWEQGMVAARESLGQGDPVLVLTSFETAEMGKNPQYIPSEETRKRSIDLGFGDGKRDFDFMAAEVPTHVFSSKLEGEDEAYDQSLMTMLYEQRTLAEEGEISISAMMGNMVRAVAGSRKDAGRRFGISVRTLPSYRAWVTRKLVQATGRLCRSGLKARSIRIVLTSALADSVSEEEIRGIPVTYEMKEVLAACMGRALAGNPSHLEIDPRLSRLYNLFTTRNEKARAMVGRLVHSFRSVKVSRDRYKELGDFVLRSPTIEELDIDVKRRYGIFLAEFPAPVRSYTYTRSSDFSSSWCVPRGMLPVEESQGDRRVLTVSEEQSGLTELMRVPVIRDFFLAHGYATSWAAGRFILNPCAANDIYKGRLGEQAFAAAYDWIHGRNGDLPGLIDDLSADGDLSRFELFDFRLAGTRTFIDAKNFSTYDKTGQEFDRYLEHVREKMDAVDAGTVIYVNAIYPENGSYPKLMDLDDGRRLLVIPGLVRAGEFDPMALELIIKEAKRAKKEVAR